MQHGVIMIWLVDGAQKHPLTLHLVSIFFSVSRKFNGAAEES